MLGRFLLAGMVATFALSAVDLDGNWVGILVLADRPGRVSLLLHENGRSVSGTVALGDAEPVRIRHAAFIGDLLRFGFEDADGNIVRFHLKLVNGLTVGSLSHAGEALTGDAEFGERLAQVTLPFHNRCSMPAVLLQAVPAEYSKEARAAQVEGAVFLSVRIDTSGQPSEVHVMRGLGMGLDEKAVEALKKWQFQAALRDGAPVPFETVVAMKFRYF